MSCSPTKRFSKAFFLAATAAIATALTAISGPASAERVCKPFFGPFESGFADPSTCEPDALFCTQGRVIGGLVGDFRLNVFELIPSAPIPESSVFFFVGESQITMRPHGDLLIGIDTGAIDQDPAGDGHFGTLLTFDGGTGAFAGATGHIVISGNADFLTGAVMGDYSGEVCKL